ncbi:helix-turn-helix transcriptional regulator [Streptomyces sporangiiformans]|nr:helix-turn-helix transcriptional regulator [Streptomyces sporangiiformans]
MEILAGRQADGLVHDNLTRCTKELLAARPAADPIAELCRHTDLLQRGVHLRALYHHTARASGAMRDHAHTAAGLGAQLRTVERLPCEVLIIDRRLALMDHGPSRIMVISEQRVVDHFVRVFEHVWEEGWVFPAVTTRHPDFARPAEADPKLAILRMLSEGAKDEQVARRLGLSLRTCRRHIADVMSNVGAVSRFQAGVLAARYGLLSLPSVPDDLDGVK